MGLDWRTLGWKEYQMALAGWNATQSTDESQGKDFTRLKRAMEAHTVH